jgi:hypothetical protein
LYSLYSLLIGPNDVSSGQWCNFRHFFSEAPTMRANVTILSNGNPTECPSLLCGPSGGASNLKCRKERATAGVLSCPVLQTLRGCVMSPEWGHFLGNVMRLFWPSYGLTLEHIIHIYSLLRTVYEYTYVSFCFFVQCHSIVLHYTYTHTQQCIHTLFKVVVYNYTTNILWCCGIVYLRTHRYTNGVDVRGVYSCMCGVTYVLTWSLITYSLLGMLVTFTDPVICYYPDRYGTLVLPRTTLGPNGFVAVDHITHALVACIFRALSFLVVISLVFTVVTLSFVTFVPMVVTQ